MTKEKTETVFGLYADMVYRICFMYFKNSPHDIEDAVSSVFMKYLEHDSPFENSEHEKAWLITTAQNTCRSALRHWWRKKTVSLDEITELSSSDIPPFEISELMSAVLALPEKQRNAVYLYYYEDYTAEQIAKMYYVSTNTVYGWLAKGRKRLKKALNRNVL